MTAALWKTGTSNSFSSTLNGGITDTDSTIALTTTTGLQYPGVTTIDRIDANNTATPTVREYVSYTGISGNSLTGCTRGLGGSTAQAHSSGAKVEETFSVTHWNDMQDALLNILTSAGALDTTKVVNATSAQTLTNKTLTAPTITTPTIDTIASTRVNPRTNTVASSATPTINTDTTDVFTITALAADITSMTTNLSGTPVNGQSLIIRIEDDGTARAIAWGASFQAMGADLPTTTTLSKVQYNGFKYNSTDSKWDLLVTQDEG